MTDVVIFTTSMATTSKIKKDTYRIKQLLDTKKVPYKEVRLIRAPDVFPKPFGEACCELA